MLSSQFFLERVVCKVSFTVLSKIHSCSQKSSHLVWCCLRLFRMWMSSGRCSHRVTTSQKTQQSRRSHLWLAAQETIRSLFPLTLPFPLPFTLYPLTPLWLLTQLSLLALLPVSLLKVYSLRLPTHPPRKSEALWLCVPLLTSATRGVTVKNARLWTTPRPLTTLSSCLISPVGPLLSDPVPVQLGTPLFKCCCSVQESIFPFLIYPARAYADKLFHFLLLEA